MSKTGATAGSAHATHRLARSLRRRDIASCIVRVTPFCLSAGTLVWCGLIGVARWFQYPAPEMDLAGLIGLLSITGAATIGLFRSRSSASMLLQADQILNLPSTLSNGAQLEGQHDPFSQAAVQESERVAQSIGRQQRGRIAPIWTMSGKVASTAGLAVAASCGLIAFTLWWAPQPGASSTISQDAAQSLIDEAAAALASKPAPTPDELSTHTAFEDPIAARARAELDAIERELRDGTAHPQDAALRAAHALENAAEAATSESKAQQEIADSATESLSKAATSLSRESPGQNDTASRDLTTSIAQADLERAAALADEIASRPADLSKEQREQLAAELQSMADSLRNEASQAAAVPDQNAAQNSNTNASTIRPEASPTSNSAAAQSQTAPLKQDIAQALERAASSLREPPSPRSEKAETRDKPSQSSANNSSVPPDGPPRNGEQVGAAKRSESGTRANQASEQSQERQTKPSETSSTTDRAQSNSSEKQTSSTGPNHTSQNGSRSSDSERPASSTTQSQSSAPGSKAAEKSEAAKSSDRASDNTLSSKADSARPGSQTKQAPGSPSKTSESPPKSPNSSGNTPTEPSATDQRKGTQPNSTGSDEQATEPDNASQPLSNQPSEKSSLRSARSSETQPNKTDSTQSEDGKSIGPPTSRTSDQVSDPNNQQNQPQDKPNALSQLAQKLRSVDRARQGQDPRAQEWRQKAQDLLSKSEPQQSDSASASPPAPRTSSRSGEASQTSNSKVGPGGMQPRDGHDAHSSPNHPNIAGANDSAPSNRPQRSGASQQLDFNPAQGQTMPATRDRVIAELPSSETPATNTPRSSNAPSLAESVQNARKQADRAIESQSIPREYQDLIRRVFRRYESRGNSPAAAPTQGDGKLSPDAAPAQPSGTGK